MSSSDVVTETPKLKRKGGRPIHLDLAPKKPREDCRGLRDETTGDAVCPQRRLTYDDESVDSVLKVKSDERGATMTVGLKWIQLTKEGFLALKNVISLIDSNLENDVSDQIRIQDGIYACTSFFRNTWSVDIRKHVIDSSGRRVPTRYGVYMKVSQWNRLKTLMARHSCTDTLKDSFLGRAAITVIGQYIAYNFMEYDELKCQGCVEDWLSQRDHVCCMDENFVSSREQKRREYLQNVKNRIDIHWFTARLVARCENQNIELTRIPRYLLYKTVDNWSDELLIEADKWRAEVLDDDVVIVEHTVVHHEKPN
jgi:hypothetical protein